MSNIPLAVWSHLALIHDFEHILILLELLSYTFFLYIRISLGLNLAI